MKLLKSISVLAILLSTTLSNAQWGNGKKIKGNGNITTANRATGSYDGLKASGPMDFKLVKGKEGDITIKADANLIDYIFTEVKDNYLIIKVEKGVNLKPTETIVITVPYKDIDYVGLAGSGDITSADTITADSFEVALAGSGDIELNVNANSIESGIAGSGDIKLTGESKNLKTNIAGSGDFDGASLNSINVEAKISGSGDIDVVCNGDLYARVSGSGDIHYTGNPTNKDTKISGSGSVSN